MKNYIFFPFLFILLCLLCSCNNDEDIFIPEVIVKISYTNYDQTSFLNLFPHQESLNQISSAFTNNYSEERKNELLNNMKAKVAVLREDVGIIENILTIMGCNNVGAYVLPTYAERAKFNGQEAWLIQFTYALDTPVFGRVRCIAFSIPDIEELFYFTTH